MNCTTQTACNLPEPLLTIRVNWPALAARIRTLAAPVLHWRSARKARRHLRARVIALSDLDCRALQDIAFSCELRDAYTAHKSGAKTLPRW
ncbi:MAG: hypothetical protein RL341_1239 [Pseudomonadota bacterium]|jgi:hypothetical protein